MHSIILLFLASTSTLISTLPIDINAQHEKKDYGYDNYKGKGLGRKGGNRLKKQSGADDEVNDAFIYGSLADYGPLGFAFSGYADSLGGYGYPYGGYGYPYGGYGYPYGGWRGYVGWIADTNVTETSQADNGSNDMNAASMNDQPVMDSVTNHGYGGEGSEHSDHQHGVYGHQHPEDSEYGNYGHGHELSEDYEGSEYSDHQYGHGIYGHGNSEGSEYGNYGHGNGVYSQELSEDAVHSDQPHGHGVYGHQHTSSSEESEHGEGHGKGVHGHQHTSSSEESEHGNNGAGNRQGENTGNGAH